MTIYRAELTSAGITTFQRGVSACVVFTPVENPDYSHVAVGAVGKVIDKFLAAMLKGFNAGDLENLEGYGGELKIERVSDKEVSLRIRKTGGVWIALPEDCWFEVCDANDKYLEVV